MAEGEGMTGSPDTDGPPLTEPWQVNWRMKVPNQDGECNTNVHTDGTQYWWGHADYMIRRVTPEVFASIKGES